jgi:two-component system LytT family response regulator
MEDIMRISICDDDSLITEKLTKYINNYFEHNHIKCPEIVCFSNGEDLLADSGNIDILFLDIEMPGVNGIYVGKELKKRNDNIIIFIVTSYSEYLDEAMRFHVFRYLSKPVDKQRLFRNLKDALLLYNSITCKIPIETKQGVQTLPAASVISVEAQGRKVIIHTTLRDFETIHNMQYWQDTLPQNRFFRTHRSFIINFEYVTDFDHTLIHLANNQFSAYLTRRKYSEFKNAYLLYLESTR